jgi:hypothetical protein
VISEASIRQDVMDDRVSAIARIDGVMGAIDEQALTIEAYEHPPTPRPGLGEAALPFGFVAESDDEEQPSADEITGVLGWNMLVNVDVAYRFDPNDPDGGFKRQGRAWVARIQKAFMADPNCGGRVHMTTEKGNAVLRVPDANVGIARVWFEVAYTRGRQDPNSREATLAA